MWRGPADGRPLSLTARVALTTAALAVLGLAAAGWLLMALFVDHAERRFDALIDDESRHIEAALIDDGRGGLALSLPLETPEFDEPRSGWMWQLRRGARVLAQSGSTPPGALLAAPQDAMGYAPGPEGVARRGVARTVTAPDGAPAVLHVLGDAGLIEGEVARFRRAMQAVLVAVGAGLALAQALLAGVLLAPLRQFGNEVRAMRRGENAPRPGAWPPELAPLAAELAALQAHNRLLVERARRQAADLAHGLKTPLAVMGGLAEEAPPALRRELDEQLGRMGAAVRRGLDGNRAVGAPAAATNVRDAVDGLLMALARPLRSRGLTATNLTPAGLATFCDLADLEEMLGPLLENAATWARSRVEITARAAGDTVTIEVADDGPGIPSDRRVAALARGVRLDERASGHGLGLAIAADVASLCRGRLTLDVAALGGAAARLSLPGGLAGAAR